MQNSATGLTQPDKGASEKGVRRPRILWANTYCLMDTSSGASMSVREMLLQLTAQGYEIAILGATVFDNDAGRTHFAQHEQTLAELDRKGQRFVEVNDGPLRHRLVLTASGTRDRMTHREIGIWYQAYIAMLEHFRPDVVFYYGGQALDMLISAEARLRGIPSAAYLANGNYHGTRWCHDIDLILTDTEATAEMYRKRSGFQAVPIGKFIAPNRVVAAEHERKHLLFINPSLAKGAGIVIQLAMLLERRRPDIRFEVVTSRGNWHALVRQITGMHGEARDSLDNVVVTPNTKDMRPVYGRARVLLAPSLWWESGPRVLVEALLNGIPAIVTDRIGLLQQMGNAGIKVQLPEACYQKPYNQLPKETLLTPLVEKIEKFFDDEVFYGNYVKRARQAGKTHFAIATSTKRLLAALAPLVAKKAGDRKSEDVKHLLQSTHKQLSASTSAKMPVEGVDAK